MQVAQHREALIQYADTEEVLVEDVCLVTAEEDEALVETTIYPPISPRVNTPIPQSHQPEQEVVTLEQYKKTLTVEKRY